MINDYKNVSHEEFLQYIEKLCKNLEKFIKENELKIDYVCPILRSGAMPAVYISNRLNIVKFLPMQVKHISYKNGDDKIEMIFNPFNSVQITKQEPVFLVVEALQSSGTSAKICINEIKNRYKNAKILYVCLTKQYGSQDFKDMTIYEDTAIFFKGENKFSAEKCKELNVENFHPLFTWENLEVETNHPDDLEENIFF